MSENIPNWRALRPARVSAGLNLEDVADGVCSPSYLSLIETGKRPLTAAVWQKLAPTLNPHISERSFALDAATYLNIQSSIRLSRVPSNSTLARLDPVVADLLAVCINSERKGSLSEARSAYRELHQLANGCDDNWHAICGGATWAKGLYVLLAEQLSRLEADSNQLSAAIEVAEVVIDNPRCVSAAEEIRSLKGLLSGLYSEIGELGKANDILQELDETGSSKSQRAMALWLRGQILVDSGKVIEGAFVLHRANSLLQDDAAVATRLRLTNAALWAECLADTRLNLSGLQDIASAVSFFRAMDNTPDLASCLNTMAFVAAKCVLNDLASECNAEAERLSQVIDGARKASLLAGVALVHSALGQTEKALACLREARLTLERGDHGRKSASIWAQMSEQYEKLGDMTSSLACLKASLASVGITGSPMSLPTAMRAPEAK